MYKALVPIAALLCSSASYASCDGAGRTLFACATAQGNRVEVCDAGSSIRYAFGEAGNPPQVAVSVPRDQVQVTSWRPQGQLASYAVKIPYGEATHVVHWSVARADAEPDAGVDVLIDREYKATIRCASGQIANHLASG